MVSDVDPSGDVIAVKRSRNEQEAERLVHEAEVLAAAQHPGVVELVGCERAGDVVRLSTRFVGTHSVETAGAMNVERAAGLVAALAETVADLHDLGVVHGRIDPSHVLIGAEGRPVLCGFAGGGRVGTTPPPGSTAAPGFCDPAASRDTALVPQLDVYGIGALLRALVVDGGVDVEPIPDRRFTFGRLRAPWSGYQRRALLTLADRATDEVPLRRPPARRLAREIHDTVPSAHLGPDAADPYAVLRMSIDADDEPPRRRIGPMVAIGAGAVLLAFSAMTMRSSDAGPVASPRTTGSTNSAGQTVRSSVPACDDLGPTAVDFDADGCGDPVRIDADGTVVAGSKRFAVGVTGDRMALGDWDCDGISTPAVLRPQTGSIFVFDRWTSDGEVSVQPVTLVPDAVDLLARDEAGCSSLVVVRADGSEQEVK